MNSFLYTEIMPVVELIIAMDDGVFAPVFSSLYNVHDSICSAVFS